MRKTMNVLLALLIAFTAVFEVTPVIAEDTSGEPEVTEEKPAEETEIIEEVITEDENTEPVIEQEEEVELASAPEEPTIGFMKTEITVEYGNIVQQDLGLSDSGYTVTCVYSSDNEAVAIVEESGTVTPRVKGEAVITASVTFTREGTETQKQSWEDYSDGKLIVTKSASYKLTVTKPEPILDFETATFSKYYNQTFKNPAILKDAVENTTAADYDITYTSDNPGVLSVNSDGSFTTKGIGVARVTAIAVKKDNKEITTSASFTVTSAVTPVYPEILLNGKQYICVKWKRTDATQYQLQYSRNADYSASLIKTYNASTLSAKLRKNKKKKLYYVRMRAVKVINGKTYYSDWYSTDYMLHQIPAGVKTVSQNFDYYANNVMSDTKYLMLIDITNCYTAIYQKKNGKFVRKYLWLCSPGKPETPSITGMYTVIKRKKSFVSYGERAWYATGFTAHRYTHSITYYTSKKKKWVVKDARLGMRISHGCIRLNTSNALWIYKKIPMGTTVLCVNPGELIRK